MTQVPAEFLGQARVFRQAVLMADARVNVALPAIIEPIQRRLATKPRLRPATLIDTVRAWNKLFSDQFTFDRRIRVDRDLLTIAELRVAGSRWRTDSWNYPDWQQGISLAWVVIEVKDGRFRFVTLPAANLLLHAVARRFERGEGRSIGDVTRDLRVLAAALDGDADEIPTQGGCWRGERHAARDDDQQRNVRVFNCKTFVNP